MNIFIGDIQGLCLLSNDCCDDYDLYCKSDDLCDESTCGQILINNQGKIKRACLTSFFLKGLAFFCRYRC